MPHRHILLTLAAAFVVPLSGCTPPDSAAVTSCTSDMQLGIQNPVRDCVLDVRRFKGQARLGDRFRP